MKKFLTVICFSFLSLSFANAEIFSVGVSGNLGLLSADGKEKLTGTTNAGVDWGATAAGTRTGTATSVTSTGDEDMAIGYVSLFAEAHLLDTGLRAGINYVPYSLESETTNNARNDNCSGGAEIQSTTCTKVSTTVQVDIEDMVMMYIAYHHQIENPFVSSVFIKAGVMEADVITNEKVGSGSSYGNTTLKGEFIGVGAEKMMEGGFFIRGEGNVTQFNDISVKNTNSSENNNTISITGLDGATATISVGKTF